MQKGRAMILHKDVLWTVPVLQTNQTATDDNHPDGRFSYSVIHRYPSQKSYPANFAKVD